MYGRRTSGTADALAMARDALEVHLERTFGPAFTRAWDRVALVELPLPVIAAGLRRAALYVLPNIADTLGQRSFSQATQTIRNADRRPRRFHWPHGLHVHLTVRSVELRFSVWDGHRAESDPPE